MDQESREALITFLGGEKEYKLFQLLLSGFIKTHGISGLSSLEDYARYENAGWVEELERMLEKVILNDCDSLELFNMRNKLLGPLKFMSLVQPTVLYIGRMSALWYVQEVDKHGWTKHLPNFDTTKDKGYISLTRSFVNIIMRLMNIVICGSVSPFTATSVNSERIVIELDLSDLDDYEKSCIEYLKQHNVARFV